jgi:hypothetical protein
MDKIVAAKVNGKLVMEWLDLTEKDGKLIGQIMNKVRELGKYKLIEMSSVDIINLVVETHKQLTNEKV